MTKRMLIDATHAEESRVVVLDGNRLEDFDVETSTKKQLKGNIYLAKVVRVEPSLQAAFVEYGGGRHGFLAFGEIHPDYYQIPVADRQRLLKMQADEARAEEEAADAEAEAAPERGAAERGEREGRRDEGRRDEGRREDGKREDGRRDGRRRSRGRPRAEAAALAVPQEAAYGEVSYGAVAHGELANGELALDGADAAPVAIGDAGLAADETPVAARADLAMDEPMDSPMLEEVEVAEAFVGDDDGEGEDDEAAPEELGGEGDEFEGNGADEAAERRMARFLRNYRIQEVIRRRQIMLVQVVKEERGTKGAALTTYLSLAGRFCVLMPNSPRGGGISRKITSASDRRRLKEIMTELEIPQGMGLIVRTAGAARPKPEIKRDCEYLMNQWDSIRETTLKSVAPALIYEEASLIKRAIRDGYSRDIDEVVVDGEAGWRAARDFMRMLMPSHAKKVQLWRPDGPGQPLFARNGVEDQLDAMLSPTVQLKSGGYLVINQAEALVAIDVNSGRATRERGIEETALRTNLEAADEVARQLRLRDLAGLIVIDFIDMESRKNNAMVERRLKEALKNDRARIQIGQISHFGLLEMSRQRLRPSLTETSFITCPHCAGMGLVRSVESSSVHVLRQIEDEGAKARAGHIMVHVAGAVAMYILNNKRDRLGEIEARYGMRVHFSADESLVAPHLRIDRLRPPLSEAERAVLAPPGGHAAPVYDASEDDVEDMPDVADEEDEAPLRETRVREVAVREVPVREIPVREIPVREIPVREEADEDAPGEAVAAAPQGAAEAESGDEAERRRRRRRRRRGGRREDGEEAGGPEGGEVASSESAPEGADAETVPVMAEGTAAAPDAEPVAEEAVATGDPTAQEQPGVNPEDFDEDGQPRARRRGRRGGRRRRRDEGGEEAADAPVAAAPPPAEEADPLTAPPARVAPPAYTGPTPADPFGGQALDIFDILERAEMAEAAAPPRRGRAVQAELEIPPVPDGATGPADIVAPEAVADVVAPEAVADVVAPEAVADVVAPEAVAEPAAAPEPEPAVAAAAPVEPVPVMASSPAVEAAGEEAPLVGPVVKPIVIGDGPLPVERKRGWWKR
jgi:ribonuclease E